MAANERLDAAHIHIYPSIHSFISSAMRPKRKLAKKEIYQRSSTCPSGICVFHVVFFAPQKEQIYFFHERGSVPVLGVGINATLTNLTA